MRIKRPASALFLVTAGSFAVALIVAGGFALRSSAATPVTVGIDFNTADNTATSVGAITTCLEVPSGGSYALDIYVQNVPGDTDPTTPDGMVAGQYTLNSISGNTDTARTATGGFIDLGTGIGSPGTAAIDNVSSTPVNSPTGADRIIASNDSAIGVSGAEGDGFFVGMTYTAPTVFAATIVPLTLTGVTLVDASANQIPVGLINNATLVVAPDGTTNCAALSATPTMTRTPRPTAHATSAPRKVPPGSATTYQLNALHDGHGLGGLLPPLSRAWSLDLGATVSYPLVVNGRVFVATENRNGQYGAQLYAIDEHGGSVIWGPIALLGTYAFNGIAADGANVYSVNFDGLLRAFDQATGTQIWQRQLPGQYAFTSPPTVANGTVFVGGAGSGGTLYAVSAASGSVLWTASVENGDHSSPAVTSDGVYVSYACEVSYRFDPTTGQPIWTHTTDCEGGGGRTPVVHGDRVYVRDDAGKPPVILRKADGSPVGTFSSLTAPAFDGKVGFYTGWNGTGLTLTAVDLTSGSVMWSQIGDGTLSSAPLVIDGKVAMGSSSGMVALYDEKTGAQVWSANAGAGIHSPDEHSAHMLVGLAGADGMLFVPASTTLVAYGSK